MSYLAIALFLLQEYKFLSILLIFLFGFILNLLFFKKPVRVLLPGAVLLLLILFCNLFAGFAVRNWLIEISGVPGEGMMTKVSDTSSMYNHQPIKQFAVTLRGAQGELFTTTFYSDDFNVVHGGDWNRTFYPGAGEKFKILYLPAYPRAFVILTDSDSEYGRRLQSTARMAEYSALGNQLKMDPANAKAQARINELATQDETIRAIYEGQIRVARLQEYNELLERLRIAPEDASALARIEVLAKLEDSIQSLWRLNSARDAHLKLINP